MDNDHSVIEQIYSRVKATKQKNVLPLWVDLANPSSDIGWENRERDSLLRRPLPDAVLALALIHHLAISNNLPLSKLAEFFAKICKVLIIEFIPKGDPQVKVLLQSREDIFTDYNEEVFEKEFSKFFSFKEGSLIPGSRRILYRMINKNKVINQRKGVPA
jgi:hypothetical protein